MSAFNKDQVVAEIVTRQPSMSAAFQDMGVDFCCGGKKTLEQACRDQGISLQDLMEALDRRKQQLDDQGLEEPAPMSLTELADHIESTHHQYLKSELPRLIQFTEKVARVHGSKDSRLVEIHNTLIAAVDEVGPHMMKEEQILFPAIRQLEKDQTADIHGGSIAGPIRQMEIDHDSLGDALKTMRRLSDGYQAPDWACNTYRAMIDGLHRLEKDLHIHVHKENNVLFPRALELESRKPVTS